MKNIFFDLDGTLIDSKVRLFNLFQCLVPESKLEFDQYWRLKRDKISHEEILKNLFSYSTISIEKFKNIWMTKIEDSDFLFFDKPFEGVMDILLRLKFKEDKLYLVTERQLISKVMEQIDSFGWQNLFENVFVTEQKTDKRSLIKNSVTLNENDWIIGDTGRDIETGKKLGIKTISVLTGFLSKEKLIEYKPDLIVDSITSLDFNIIL